ncbi:MAG: metallophosphoesterase family protein [Oscillospiraceae bacterium]|jgi:UDP-2,3-diacylglucosamine pyrophosphatase LpxH|nr:metallophosphoesterase family protein [Oscillospiraceae bacterium]
MSTSTRLSRAFAACPHIPVDSATRFVFMSDCHRGLGDGADDFAQNVPLWHAAMEHYWRGDYTYFELGDGDELWENHNFSQILEAHRETFAMLERFHRAGRFHMLYGNHDIVKRSAKWREKNLQGCVALNSRLCVPFFEGLRINEAIILDDDDGRKYYLCHGHQADIFNSTLWRVTRFAVHTVWVPLEIFGMREPFRVHEHPKRLDKIEQRLADWSKSQGAILIAGHTHRAYWNGSAGTGYANDGCCVHPGEITALELTGGKLHLVQWRVRSRADGGLYAGRVVA